MTAPKFTPGRWETGGESDPLAILCVSSYFQVAAVNEVLEQAAANAHLIAAAPELYEALAQAFEREYNPFEPDNQSDRYHRWGALLAKARGESNG